MSNSYTYFNVLNTNTSNNKKEIKGYSSSSNCNNYYKATSEFFYGIKYCMSDTSKSNDSKVTIKNID